jgi:hypothetical protein
MLDAFSKRLPRAGLLSAAPLRGWAALAGKPKEEPPVRLPPDPPMPGCSPLEIALRVGAEMERTGLRPTAPDIARKFGISRTEAKRYAETAWKVARG